jgi:uncharacterized protein YlxW (UPF0749 family)
MTFAGASITVATGAVFGLSVPEIIAVIAAIAYITSLLRDWRPMKALRNENRDLRDDLTRAQVRIDDLENEVDTWKKRTDLSILQKEQREIAAVLDRLVKHLDRLDGSVKANTAAVELIARKNAINDALDDRDHDAAA